MNWTPGPARCRSAEYEAEIAFTDMPGDFPIYGRIRKVGENWRASFWAGSGGYGRMSGYPQDLMPPTITREALALETADRFDAAAIFGDKQWERIVAHVIDAVKSGRVE